MQASLHWNDDEERIRRVAILTAPLLFLTLTPSVIPAKAGIQWLRQAIPA